MAQTPQLNDYDLTLQDIAAVENAEEVVHFFAKLGYDVSEATRLTSDSLSIENEDLRHHIKGIRKVGVDPADAEIEIYLFELRSVTVAVTHAVMRQFRQRSGSFLFVLTSDYERIDLVLLDRIRREETSAIGGQIKYIPRPRVLTVHRHRADEQDRIALRVLRRFTFTEADGLSQWEKLRSAYTMAEWSEPNFNNRALFSDYYLNKRLTDSTLTPEWIEDARPAGRKVLDILGDARATYTGQPGEVVRAALIEPLFELLGFTFNTEAGVYRLYSPGQTETPAALALAYSWNRNLDDSDPQRDEANPDEIPGARVVTLLEQAEAPWVIVTNGKLWRLYSATASNKATNYYEVDLEEALFAPESDRITAFKYWWLMFRAGAFQGFLDGLLAKSADYAQELREGLKNRIFESIFPYFGEGFIENMRLQGVADIDLDATFSGTMTFLYRLMFALYAESLELLPVKEERGYGEHSLYNLKQEIANVGGPLEDVAPKQLEKHYSDSTTGLYTRLLDLFHSIDTGDPDINLPIYNGGLFSAESDSGTFLEQFAIPDRYLALGLDRLSRDIDSKTGELVFIDFKSLGVRQLGSVYEGLLEFKLRIAAEKLAVIREKNREVYVPFAKAKTRVLATLEPGAVYLENTRQERKATGSYYTPDYIVKYIVEHTVGPVLEAKFAALEPRLREAQKKYRQNRALAIAKKEDPGKFWNDDAMRYLADDCLDMRVLDPAMGSGHFLVEVVDFVSNRLITFLNGWSENPVWALLERTRADIVDDVLRQGVTIDAGKLTRVALLKRAVLKRCVYGVDLNRMAVELAKVSLWLDAFTLGAPLSFLDHHLKHGNSLIGARVGEVQAALEGQQTLFSSNKFVGVMLATDLMRQVSYLSDNTIAQTKQSAQAFRSASDHLAPYKRVLDVYTSRWFGNTPTAGRRGGASFDPTIEFLKRDDTQAWLEDPYNPKNRLPADDYMKAGVVAKTTLEAAQDKHFFHWELEFPEIFFAPSTPGGTDVQLRAGGGFDVVVGNPPYDELSEDALGREIDEEEYLTKTSLYEPTHESSGRLNWYHYFMVLSLKLLVPHGRNGFIVPMSWMGDSFTLGIRTWMLKEHLPVLIEAFPQKDDPNRRVFREAKLPTSVYISEKSRRNAQFWVRVHPGKDILDIAPYYADLTLLTTLSPESLIIPPTSPAGLDLLLRLATTSNLGRFSSHGAEPTSGEIIFNKATRPYLTEDSSYDLILRGSHVQRYELAEVAKQGEPVYLKTEEYLKATRNDAKAFAHQRPRIVYQEGSAIDAWRRVVPTFLPEGNICGHKICYFVNYKVDLYALLGVYGSALINWLVESLSVTNSLPAYLVGKLPFPKFENTIDAARRKNLGSEAKTHYAQSLTDGHDSVLAFTAERIEWGETDVVHDLLAFLAETMIDLNKQKQAEVKRFLAWLEDTLQIAPKGGETGIDSLPGKTIIQGYLGDYQKGEAEADFDAVYDKLFANRKRFRVSLLDMKPRIEDEYHRSLGVLLPIKRQLEHTDTLIDRIVYQLYGLTDEEIRLIEGPQYEQAVAKAKELVLRDEAFKDHDDEALSAIGDLIQPAAQRLDTVLPPLSAEASLDQDFPTWRDLPERARNALRSAERQFLETDETEFTGSVVNYAKAVEISLNELLFTPFRAAGYTDRDVENEMAFKPFMRGQRKGIMLGSMDFVLTTNERTFHSFVLTLYPNADNTIFSKTALRAFLTPQQIERRNRAAHDDAMSRQDAEDARNWASGILQHL